MQLEGMEAPAFGQGRGFNPGELCEGFQEEFREGLNLTPEQEKALDEMRRDMQRGDRGQRFEQMRSRMERLQKMLPPEDYKKFIKKLEERRGQFRGRFGRPPQGERPRGESL